MSDPTPVSPTPSPRQPQSFDYRGALAAGYSPKEIADHLASDPSTSPIDIAGARAAGWSDQDIIGDAAARHGDRYDIHGAIKAGVSAQAIASEYASRPDAFPYDVAAARKAGVSDEDIVAEIASKTPSTLLGGIIGAPAAKAVHDAALAVIPGSVQRGTAHAVEGLANTADVLGATNVGGYLHNQVNKDQLNATTSAEALQSAYRDGHYGQVLLDLPGAVGEALPQFGAAVAGAAGGAAAGAAMGGPVGGVGGFVAGAGADALTGVLFQAGDIAKARAKADGRSEPNDSDIAAAVGSSAVLGSLDRIGLGKAAGGFIANGIKRALGRESAGAVGTAVGSMAAHGASDAAQSVGQQLATTAGTEQGATIDPNAVASQAIIGAGSRGALVAARSVQDRVTGQAALDAKAAQATSDRAAWATMTPEDQQRVMNTAGAGQAMAGVQDSAVGNIQPGQAARTAIAQRMQAVNDYAKQMASDDVGLLDSDHLATIRQAVAAASRPSQALTTDHIDAIDSLPLPERQRHALIGTLGEMNVLSDKTSLEPVGGPISQGLGLAGHIAAHAAPLHGPAGFVLRPVINYAATKAGSWLDGLMGASKPRLEADANRAAAMLDANGLQVPDNRREMQKGIAASQNATQVMAQLVGLDPSDYGPPPALRDAANRAATRAALREPPSLPSTMGTAEAIALARSGMASGTPLDTPQTPNASSGSGVAGGAPGVSTGLPATPGHMAEPELLMRSTPPQPPGSELGQRLPRWMWVMGNKVQQDLALSGMHRNLNYAQEAKAVIGQLRDSGIIDGPLHDKLMTYTGDVMPRGFFNLVRQQWLLNHGIDRRTLAAQSASGTSH